jgi:hypothetical protein
MINLLGWIDFKLTFPFKAGGNSIRGPVVPSTTILTSSGFNDSSILAGPSNVTDALAG